MGGHGSLGGETTEDTHGINEVTKERNSNNFIDSLVQRVERERKIQKDIRMCRNEGETSSSSGEESSILTKIQKGNGSGRSSKGLKTFSESIPFFNCLRAVFSLLHEQLFEFGLGTDRESPVAGGGPVSQSCVSLYRHFFFQDVENHTQGVETGTVQTLKDTRSNFKAVFSSIVHTRKGVSTTSTLDVRFQDHNLVTVLGTEGTACQTTHSRTDDDNIVFTRITRKSISGSGVSWFFVFGFQRHIIRESHNFFT
mmetsp:Transcript_26718/g.37660  ORF Transcript_26718/g.37660 Transcript_26718/m.37660 type:complete len:254 (-) Transcript_26718:63-824(-)